MLTIQIELEDIQGAGHGNTGDPLSRALLRTTGKEYWTETYSQGLPMQQGHAWLRDFSENYHVDVETTQALQRFDKTQEFEPRPVVLTPVE